MIETLSSCGILEGKQALGVLKLYRPQRTSTMLNSTQCITL